jgi:hypothetical protein
VREVVRHEPLEGGSQRLRAPAGHLPQPSARRSVEASAGSEVQQVGEYRDR